MEVAAAGACCQSVLLGYVIAGATLSGNLVQGFGGGC